jgi:hypothetical protein
MSVGLFMLVEQGRLSSTDTVFGQHFTVLWCLQFVYADGTPRNWEIED